MSTFKKIVILNGIDNSYKAVVKLEVLNCQVKVHAEVMLAISMPYKKFTLVIGLGNKILNVVVDKKAVFECEFNGSCSLDNGVSVLIKGDNKPILYGESGNPTLALNDLLKEPCIKNLGENEELFIYDDEQLALENYYGKSEDENVLPTQNDYQFKSNIQQKEERQKKAFTFENEESSSTFKSQEFYLKNKSKLDEIFNKYEPFYELNSIIPNGKFARVNYNQNHHYIVGIICENEIVKYVCYGVPKMSEAPPKNLEKYCKFIPTTQDFKSGYYLVFQCANSGNLV
ncbi:MAG: hypothetical protein IKV61_06985 [Clostridia bacterium]|nr:hypothetical protein [Clostridia bacterium]